ncbi:MAG: HAD-IIB family hydrolase [Erysipelotrichales bacterium]|nr:HAD-IIB family hydrolase [Erysipelotrichales bacterium]
MIRFIITDLDGTLFHGHGDSLFDLTSENTEALAKARANGIRVLPCSGRTVTYALRLYELHDLGTPVIAAGLNAATIYDGKMVEKYTLKNDDIFEMIEFLKKYSDKYFNMQVQDDWNTRYFLHLDIPPATTYRETTGKDRCTEVGDINLLEYLNSGKGVCRFSIMSESAEDSNFLETKLREKFDELYTITRSGKKFLEINSKLGNKARFVSYIKEKYNLTNDEVAVIGDNHNDSFMYSESNYTFAMENGEDYLKESARFVVRSVAECIEECIKINNMEYNVK